MFRPELVNQVDLTGPDGNAFALLALMKRYMDGNPDWNRARAEATSGNYDHLLSVVKENCPHIHFHWGGFDTKDEWEDSQEEFGE